MVDINEITYVINIEIFMNKFQDLIRLFQKGYIDKVLRDLIYNFIHQMTKVKKNLVKINIFKITFKK